jgi:putative ABC transport system substrate-binding protein
MSDRTLFGLLIAAVLVLLSGIASAEPADKIARIGFLAVSSGPGKYFPVFIQRLGELGHIEGKNLVIEKRWAEKTEQLPELAAGLVRANVNLIVAGGTPATVAAKQTTATIPIVFIASNPVEKGIIASLARPGGNLTGIALVSQTLKPLERLKEAAPGISHVALLYDPATFPRGVEPYLMSNRRQVETLNVTLEPVALREPDDTDKVFMALPADTDGLLLEDSNINVSARDSICGLANQRRLPAAGNHLLFASSGCLLSYGEDLVDLNRRLAGYVDRILRGAQPADLPAEQPTRLDLIINLKTAKELGLTVPVSLIMLADEVIE